MRPLLALLALAVAAAACAGERPVLTDEPAPPTTAPPSSSTTTTTTPPPPPVVTAPDGRVYPAVADDALAIGARLARIEQQLRSMAPADAGFGDIAHEQQMIYRRLGRDPDVVPAVVAMIPPDLTATVEAHIAARVAIGQIADPDADPPQNVPAWQIIEPLPADDLQMIYDEAADATGIDWAFLAAINLLETGYGRIDGLSTAGAQGPMQFLPTTWEEVGEGSIDDPRDAIPAAARYLVRRGGPADMEAALWGYNNSDAYVEAVSTYAEMFRSDEAVFEQTHAWEIHYSAAIGDLWLPVGYRRDEPVPATEHVVEAPWSIIAAAGAGEIQSPPDG